MYVFLYFFSYCASKVLWWNESTMFPLGILFFLQSSKWNVQFNYTHLQFYVPFKSMIFYFSFFFPPKEGVISYLRLENAWWLQWSTSSSPLTQEVHLLPFQEGWLTTMFCYCYDSCFVLLSTSFFSSSHTVNIYDKYKQN